MHRNPYWYVFLIVVGLIVMGYSGFTLMKVYQYSRLSQQTDPLSIKWSINKFSDDHYTLQVDYEFDWKEKTYSGTIPSIDHYLNIWAISVISNCIRCRNRRLRDEIACP